MDKSYDHDISESELTARSEDEVRAMLEQSRRDIAAGRTVPMGPVLDFMRAAADQIRSDRAASGRHTRNTA